MRLTDPAAAQRQWLPLTAEERVAYQRIYSGHSCDRPVCSMVVITRYEAALAAAETARDKYQALWCETARMVHEERQRATRLATLEAAARVYEASWNARTAPDDCIDWHLAMDEQVAHEQLLAATRALAAPPGEPA